MRKVTLDNHKSGKKISGAMSNTFLLWLLKTCITELLNITPLQLEDPRYSPTNLLFPCSVIQNRAGSPDSPANPQDGSVKYGKSGRQMEPDTPSLHLSCPVETHTDVSTKCTSRFRVYTNMQKNIHKEMHRKQNSLPRSVFVVINTAHF